MFEKILIANRGEIAVRIIRSARKMGIKTVAVYSEADTNSLHVQEADEAVYIGPSPSSESYLRIDRVIKAAQKTGAQAIHPGYGFLSENSEFAKAVHDEGLVFIGPSHDAIRFMGDKIKAKKIANRAGVNIIPGHKDAVRDYATAKKIAAKIGYPIMIKAAAGGGGKGMRIIRNDEQMKDGLRAASNEAKSSFSDDRVFIEKYIENPRHIEIQVLADRYGNVVALGERECSIQRRHQKVIEEAPSPFLDDKTRKTMFKQSIALAKEVGYISAGTIEYVVDEKKNFYFLEMNTRLQVEHRVTELITGIDIVEQMIRIAAGEKLPFAQKDIAFNGWAMEARVYAEDPTRGFLPSTGRITRFIEPENVPGLIVDTGIYEGGEVSMFYDPMVAKVCTYGDTRARAIEDMNAALGAFVIRGISHNIGFLEAIINHPRFVAGNLSTSFIDEEYPKGFSGAELSSEINRVVVATSVFMHLRYLEREREISGQLPGRRPVIGSRWVVRVGKDEYPVSVTARAQGYDIGVNNEIVSVRSSWELGRRLFQGVVGGRQVHVKVRRLAEGYHMLYSGADVRVIVRTPSVSELAIHVPDSSEASQSKQLIAPITGRVVAFRVKKGDVVKQGQELVIIEAMKMENIITADNDVTIKKIHAKPGEGITAGQAVIDFE